eukprot:m.15957 g.15957  ORF g.15957 m.15957 type:complete len:232 (-) comp5129_c0_seq2:99-794(-)
MKLLENGAFSQLSDAISGVHSDAVLHCRLEALSCKMAGQDKKLYKQLSQDGDVDEREALSPMAMLPNSPFGSLSTSEDGSASNLCHTCSRKTLYYLKATLNAAFYPDYDFSTARANEFCREPSWDWVQRGIGASLMAAMGERFSSMAAPLWLALEEEISPNECDIYSYTPDLDSDPFMEDGTLWSFNHFLYNKKLKRIVFFACRAINTAGQDDDQDEDVEPMDDLQFDMPV